MNPLLLLAAAEGGPVEQIAKTFGANVPALIANAISFPLVPPNPNNSAVRPIHPIPQAPPPPGPMAMKCGSIVLRTICWN